MVRWPDHRRAAQPRRRQHHDPSPTPPAVDDHLDTAGSVRVREAICRGEQSWLGEWAI